MQLCLLLSSPSSGYKYKTNHKSSWTRMIEIRPSRLWPHPDPPFLFSRQTLGVVKKTSLHQLSHCQFPDQGKLGPLQSVSDPDLPCVETTPGRVPEVGCEILKITNWKWSCSAQHNSGSQSFFFFFNSSSKLFNLLSLLLRRRLMKSILSARRS